MCPFLVCVMKGVSLLRLHLSQIAPIFLVWLKCDRFKWILVNIVLTWCSSARSQKHYAFGMLLYYILRKTISANNSSSVNRSQTHPSCTAECTRTIWSDTHTSFDSLHYLSAWSSLSRRLVSLLSESSNTHTHTHTHTRRAVRSGMRASSVRPVLMTVTHSTNVLLCVCDWFLEACGQMSQHADREPTQRPTVYKTVLKGHSCQISCLILF